MTSQSPFHYLGSKAPLLPWVYSIMPAKVGMLVDVFGGAGNIVLGYDGAGARVYNDINGDLVHFMRTLRDAADALITAIELTPHSREEYNLAFDPATDPIERARRTFVRLMQSFGRTLVKSGFSTTKHFEYGLSLCTERLLKKVAGLAELVQVLRHIVIECLSWQDVLQKYAGKNTYLACDPPYPLEIRTGGPRYGSEGIDHAELITTLQAVECQGWLLCTYPNELYNELLQGYPSHTRSARANNNQVRTEQIYTSQHGHERKPRQAVLFHDTGPGYRALLGSNPGT